MSDVLVTPDWLEAQLGASGVAVFDCRLTRVPQASGPSVWLSGRSAWEVGRIPGARYLHMIDDLSDPDASVPYTLPAPERIGAVMGALGARETDVIVLYGEGAESPVHRAWWVLRASGAADVRVLDGGLGAWRAAGLALESGPAAVPVSATFRAARRAELVADRAEVAAALGDPAVALVNALPPAFHRGEGAQVFGRPGRIPGSVNLPAEAMWDAVTGRFHPAERLGALADATIPPGARRVVTWCGGGIAATTTALGLALAGRGDVAVYDGSLLEWTLDPAAPMETG